MLTVEQMRDAQMSLLSSFQPENSDGFLEITREIVHKSVSLVATRVPAKGMDIWVNTNAHVFIRPHEHEMFPGVGKASFTIMQGELSGRISTQGLVSLAKCMVEYLVQFGYTATLIYKPNPHEIVVRVNWERK